MRESKSPRASFAAKGSTAGTTRVPSNGCGPVHRPVALRDNGQPINHRNKPPMMGIDTIAASGPPGPPPGSPWGNTGAGDPPAATYSGSGFNFQTIEIPQEHKHKKGTVTCRHWKRGRCDLKDRCNFAHHDGATPHTPVQAGLRGTPNRFVAPPYPLEGRQPAYPPPPNSGRYMDVYNNTGPYPNPGDYSSTDPETMHIPKQFMVPTMTPGFVGPELGESMGWEETRNTATVPFYHRGMRQMMGMASPPVIPGDCDEERYESYYYVSPMSPGVESHNDPMMWLNAPNSARAPISDDDADGFSRVHKQQSDTLDEVAGPRKDAINSSEPKI